jgi:hypothetical protein
VMLPDDVLPHGLRASAAPGLTASPATLTAPASNTTSSSLTMARA